MRRCCLAGSLLAALATNVFAEDVADLADRVVEAAGVKAGLAVHAGFGDGALMVGLSQRGNFLVHGVSPDGACVGKARAEIQALGLYGKRVSVERGSFSSLPYADDLVNLVVIDDVSKTTEQGLTALEVFRVLCPNGVLLVGGANQGLRARLVEAGFTDVTEVKTNERTWWRGKKPRPNDVGDWSHWRCDAGDNAVSRDTRVGFPEQMQWIAEPSITAGHKPPTVAVVAGGRVFYTHDETFTLFDATRMSQFPSQSFVARDSYNGLLLWKKPIPVGMRCLAAYGDRVYTVVESDGPCVGLDAVTGEIATVYKGTENTVEVRWLDGILLLARSLDRNSSTFTAVDAASGEILWEQAGGSVLASDGKVIIKNGAGLKCMDLRSGTEIWSRTEGVGIDGCTMSVYHDDVLVLIEGGRGACKLHAVSGETGKVLWSRDAVMGNIYRPVQQVAFIDGQVCAKVSSGADGRGWLFLDRETGEEKRWIGGGDRGAAGGKCTTETASQKYFYKGSAVVEIESGTRKDTSSYRSGCKPGTLPANGMTYYFPADCTCSWHIRGTFALQPKGGVARELAPDGRFEKGVPAPEASAPDPHDWPAFLCDNRRSGSTSNAVAADAQPLWAIPAGEEITAPTVAGKTVFVGTRRHGVMAFDAATGDKKWSYTTDGPVEYPPTIHEGLCLLGANDGWMYCLNVADGKLVWRLHVAPGERRMVAYDQVESTWPVVGPVTVHNGTAFSFAGRIDDLDGYHSIAVEPRTGEILWEKKGGGHSASPMLCADDKFLYYCNWAGKKSGSSGVVRLDPRDGKTEYMKRDVPDGVFAAGPKQRAFGKMAEWRLTGYAPRGVSAERIVFRGDRAFGATWDARRSPAQLFCAGPKSWSVRLPDFHTTALILAGETLFAAGRASKAGEGQVWAMSATDGSRLSSWTIGALPVSSGLAAAAGRLYLTTANGKIHCFGK